MTTKLPIYLIVALISACFAVSCNDDSNDPVEAAGSYSNTAVTSFSLQKDDSVAANLDSVFFSIDLVGSRIFNADSLPVGTDISKLLVKLGTSQASSCDITFRIPETTRDTTINLIESPNDSINFSEGPVKMVVTSYDGAARRTYSVSVNVHKHRPDTLKWDEMASSALPSTLVSPKKQKTVYFKDEAYCFTADGAKASLSRSAAPFTGTWTSTSIILPEGADINSIEAAGDAVYMIDGNGVLHTSADGINWTATTDKMNHIYGGYGSVLLGARHDTDGWKHVTYPASSETAVPDGCPVSGTSTLVGYETKWSTTPMAITIGGRDTEGRLTGEAWVYDGKIWGQLSTTGIDRMEGVSLFPYMTLRTNEKNWKVTERSTLIALGGLSETQSLSKTVYVSYDFGITWSKAETYLQLPSEMAAFQSAQALIFDTTLPVSRVTAPIENWECPYIYLFGGYNQDGRLLNELRRGVINRFTFKPIY